MSPLPHIVATLHVVLVVLALAVAPTVRAQAAVFSFVDDAGVLHLSNVAEDRRLPPRPATSAGEGGHATPNTRGPGAPPAARPFHALIEQMAARYGIDVALLHAVIAVESGYDAKAVSGRGAAGLMQLMPETARRYGVRDVFDPADNVRGGAQHLAGLLSTFDSDLRLALAAYNAGEGAVYRYGRRVPPYRETSAYVPKVIAAYTRALSSRP